MKCSEWDSNPGPTDSKSNTLTTRPPCHPLEFHPWISLKQQQQNNNNNINNNINNNNNIKTTTTTTTTAKYVCMYNDFHV